MIIFNIEMKYNLWREDQWMKDFKIMESLFKIKINKIEIIQLITMKISKLIMETKFHNKAKFNKIIISEIIN
jgi:hypothetical protein